MESCGIIQIYKLQETGKLGNCMFVIDCNVHKI